MQIIKSNQINLIRYNLLHCPHGLLYKIKKYESLQRRYVKEENHLGVNIISNKNKSLVTVINNILENAKTEQIKTIDIRKKSSYADTFVIATCRSSRHVDATADELTQQLKRGGIVCLSSEGRPQCDWVIVDVGKVIIHLFRPEVREYYNLEKLWDMSFDFGKNKLA